MNEVERIERLERELRELHGVLDACAKLTDRVTELEEQSAQGSAEGSEAQRVCDAGRVAELRDIAWLVARISNCYGATELMELRDRARRAFPDFSWSRPE